MWALSWGLDDNGSDIDNLTAVSRAAAGSFFFRFNFSDLGSVQFDL